MKSLVKIALATALTFSFMHSASASLLLEPYLGYRVSGDLDNGTSADLSYNGIAYGARVGYQMLGIMGGVDYSMSSFDMDIQDGADTSTLATSSSNLGLFVGYNAPILVRAWATYFLSNKLDFDSIATEYSGSGYALGVGFTGLPFVSLNLEYRALSFDEQTEASTTSALNPSEDASEILFTVSLPFTF